MSDLRYFYDRFAEREEREYLPELVQMMSDAGFEYKSREGTNSGFVNITRYFYRDDCDCVCAFAERENINKKMLVMMDKDFAEAVLNLNKNQPYPITYSPHTGDNSRYSPFLSKASFLHREVLRFKCGNSAIADMQVDHISRHDGVCVSEQLRLCTNEQNSRNKPTSKIRRGDDFDYKAIRDFSNSFYIPFLHYVMNAITKDEMWELRRMELANC